MDKFCVAALKPEPKIWLKRNAVKNSDFKKNGTTTHRESSYSLYRHQMHDL
jgi:hypothetical protein